MTKGKGYALVKTIKRQGWPTKSKLYPEAHSEASDAEKRKFPRGYAKLKKIDASVPQGQLIGKNTKTGKIYVSSKVPKKLRTEVGFHEKYEAKALKRLSKRKK